MARIRTIKPDFFRHELLQDLQQRHPQECPMLVFAGLFGHCDKQGVFPWRPKQLKLDILPFMPFEMAGTLEILCEHDLVRVFDSGGERYGFIPTFPKHQQIGGKESTSPAKYPAPPRAVTGKLPGSAREVTGTEKNNPQPNGEVTGTAGIRKGRELGKELGTASSPQLAHIVEALPNNLIKKFG